LADIRIIRRFLNPMAQTPNVIGHLVMQRLKERGLAATPENYERLYYEVAGLPPPKPEPEPEPEPVVQNNPFCMELLVTLREMLREVTDKTDHLARELGEKNEDLRASVSGLKKSREKSEVVRLLSLIVAQAGGIQDSVQNSHRDLVETRQSLKAMQDELAETRQLLNEDALTGALNRRGLDQNLQREIARAQRAGTTLTVAMVDLDHFKRVNDQHGHETGDQLLVHFTRLMRSVMRKSDALARYGGEEFTLILPETDARGAHKLLDRLREVHRQSPLLFEGKAVATTFSAGIATLQGEDNGHALLRRADGALFAAKDAGRDTIQIA
jgi:diguanylate cyclase